jgi:hypothetical protein
LNFHLIKEKTRCVDTLVFEKDTHQSILKMGEFKLRNGTLPGDNVTNEYSSWLLNVPQGLTPGALIRVTVENFGTAGMFIINSSS